jgi:DNA mismatch repair ATPase MutS
VEHREKEWFSFFSVVLCGGTHAAFGLRAWKRKHGAAMLGWVAAWSQLEALLALATYAAEHSANVYPEVLDGDATFEAEGITHPLLLRGQAVANDVALDHHSQFLLISGSNMAGKSTLLRTVGANVVLGLAGAPVPARRLRLTALHIGASLAIGDSLADGRSKFLAEVERLRDVLTMARENPRQSLFLIDEIFSGTNSADRRTAAESVLRGLIAAGSIGALSTHDLALAELAELPGLHGKNVHMASPDERDPLAFDYLLKPGVNRTTNALAIVKMLGLG